VLMGIATLAVVAAMLFWLFVGSIEGRKPPEMEPAHADATPIATVMES